MNRVEDRELLNWTGAIVPTVTIDGERWAIKPDGRREALGYQLAGSQINAAEVRLAPRTDGAPRGFVRLAENYTISDLPIQDLDEAAAAEMAFSLWIRRRDTHAYNRAYVDGVPLFFDHAAAFCYGHDLDHFLRPGDDNGYVPAWRVGETSSRPTTMGTRWLNDLTGLAIHPINDLARFLDCFDSWIERISGTASSSIDAALAAVGYRGSRMIQLGDLLRRSQWELLEAANRVRGVLTRELSHAEAH